MKKIVQIDYFKLWLAFHDYSAGSMKKIVQIENFIKMKNVDLIFL